MCNIGTHREMREHLLVVRVAHHVARVLHVGPEVKDLVRRQLQLFEVEVERVVARLVLGRCRVQCGHRLADAADKPGRREDAFRWTSTSNRWALSSS